MVLLCDGWVNSLDFQILFGFIVSLFLFWFPYENSHDAEGSQTYRVKMSSEDIFILPSYVRFAVGINNDTVEGIFHEKPPYNKSDIISRKWTRTPLQGIV